MGAVIPQHQTPESQNPPATKMVGEAGWALATGLVVAALTWWRVPFLFDRLWAEDATIFLADPLDHGRGSPFIHWYAGYLHTIPRLFGALAASMPLRWATLVFGMGILIVVGAGAAFVELSAGAYIERRWLRIGVALPVAVLPVIGEESIGNAANLQFFLVFFAFWLLLWFPRRKVAVAALSLALILISLSTLIAVFLLPMALGVIAMRRRPSQWLPAAALIVGVVSQFVARLLLPEAARVVVADGKVTFDQAIVWVQTTIFSNLIPPSTPPFDGEISRQILGWTLAVTIAVLMGGALVGRHGAPSVSAPPPRISAHSQRMVIISAMATAVVSAGVMVRIATASPRYSVLPALLIISALGVSIDATLTLRPTWKGWMPTGLLLAGMIASVTMGWRLGPLRAEGWSWSQSVNSAQRECDRGAKTVWLAASPPGLAVGVTCEQLSGGSP